MKILVGSFQCESNTFSDYIVQTEDFEVFQNDEALKKLAACEIFRNAGADVWALVYASALPGGEVSKQAFTHFKDIFIEGIKRHTDADGIYFYLHGSMYVQGMGSGEEVLLREIRKTIGYKIPISLDMDFHANVSPGLLTLVNAVNGFRTAPHVDHDDTERRAAKSLLKCIEHKALPKPAYVNLPVLCGDAATTERQPFRDVTKQLQKMDEETAVVSSAFFSAQPWYDSEYTGDCAVVSTLDESGMQRALALGKLFWDGVGLLTLDGAMNPDETVACSLRNTGNVLFVTDSGDNTTAGACGAGTLLLKKYLENSAENVLICGILDKQNTETLLQKDVGIAMDIILCEGLNEQQEQHTALQVTLKKKGKVYGWAGDEVGQGVLLETVNGPDIVLTDARAAFTTPEHFAHMNVDPGKYRVVVLKMGYLFPRLREISEKHIFAMTPGQSTNDFGTLQYKRLKRKMYPIYKDITWKEIEQKARRGEL